MAAGQIHDVDVIPDAGTVVGGPVVSENMQLFSAALPPPWQCGDQIIGDAVGILPDQSRRVRANGVEVAEQRDPQLWFALQQSVRICSIKSLVYP